jgi:hypothetical protein
MNRNSLTPQDKMWLLLYRILQNVLSLNGLGVALIAHHLLVPLVMKE